MPNIYQGDLARMRFWQESSFKTDGSGTLGNYIDIPFNLRSMKMVRKEPKAQPAHAIQRLDQRSPSVLMPRIDTELTFTTNLETFGTKAGSTVAAIQHWLGLMLECGMGGKHLSTGTTIASTSTTTVLNVTSASSMRAGGAIGVVIGGKFLIRTIKSISTNAVTLKMALPSAPANGATVYGIATYYLHNNPLGADPIYGQFLLEGYNPMNRWQLPGGAFKSFGFSGLEPAQIPRINWAWQFPTWRPADGTNTAANLRSAALGRASYSDIALNTMRDSYCYLRPLSSSALPSFLHAPKVDIQPAIEYEALRTPQDEGTCFGYRRSEVFDRPPVLVNLEAHWENDTTLDDYAGNGTELAFHLQVGSSPTKGAILLDVPRCEMIDPPAEISIGGVGGKSVLLHGLGPDTDTTPAGGASVNDTALAEAVWRIHCG